jgi:hypothetical protein
MIMSKWVFVLCVALFAFPSLAPAQVIYEPVRYQYGSAVKFYYGGRDPAVIAAASSYFSMDTRYFGAYGNLAVPPLHVYSDLFPYQDATLFGYTTMDAMNDAYANVPRYFRKADLLQSAERQPDGSLLVLSRAEPGHVGPGFVPRGGIEIHPYKPAANGPILIIPKGLLEKKSDNWLASAR